MDTIKSYHIYSSKAKLSKPIADATHTLTEISFIVLRMQLKSGIVGESYMLSFQYSPRAIAGAMKDIGGMVVGEKVYNTVNVFEKINAANEYFGNEGVNRWAQAAYNIAMWDAWSKTLHQPVWKVLGGEKKKI